MRRFLSAILLILALCAALTTTALAMAVYPNSEFGDPGFHHETDFSGDDDFVVYFDPERDEFHVYENKIAEGFTAIPLDEALPFIARLVGRAALGVMVVVLLFRIAGTILLFVAFARRSQGHCMDRRRVHPWDDGPHAESSCSGGWDIWVGGRVQNAGAADRPASS